MTKSLVDRWASEGEETFFFIDEETENAENQDENGAEKHEHSDKKR